MKEKKIQVFIQPSKKRVFSNSEYVAAGATVQEDLSQANTIFGVKQVPNGSLLPNKTYCFFSHTIKAQPENMALLDEILAKNVRLVDYECIASEVNGGNVLGTDGSQLKPGKPVRKVAFGKFAGRAGMIDTLRMVGESLLKNVGVSTPFLNVSSAYMYSSYERALKDVQEAGEMAKHVEHLIANPLVMCFTGNGNVTKGALEVFEKLDPVSCTVSSLQDTIDQVKEHGRRAGEAKVIGCMVQKSDLVVHRKGAPFNDVEYSEYPERYKEHFCKQPVIAKNCQVLVNGIYWDRRFPKLVTSRSIHDLPALHSIADMSCDIEGSIELLSHTTEIEDPFLRVPVDQNKLLYILGVDILPSELPRESSEYFGEQLFDYIDVLASPTDEAAKYSAELKRAVITDKGKMTDRYRYISLLRGEREREAEINQKGKTAADESMVSNVYKLYGHLFDTQVINQVLDEVEEDDGNVHMLECIVKPGKQTSMLLKTEMKSHEGLAQLEKKLHEIVSKVVNKDETQGVQLIKLESTEAATMVSPADSETPQQYAATPKLQARMYSTQSRRQPSQTVAMFGSGMMSFPALEYLSRNSNVTIHLASNAESELEAAKQFIGGKHGRSNLVVEKLDVFDQERVDALVSRSDVSLSLLPAVLHGSISTACKDQGKDFVTASYVDYSQDIPALTKRLQQKQVTFLMELGVDPGIDHMSAMQLVDDIKAQDGKVTGFASYCGGLPKLEPEKFKDNILHYKFSWSPKGVLRALRNDAAYLKHGQVVTIPHTELLKSAADFQLKGLESSYQLESLPNRDSLKYKSLYGLEGCENIFRGTLRYQGFSAHMERLRNFGYLTEENNLMDVLMKQPRANTGEREFDAFYDNFAAYVNRRSNEDGFRALSAEDGLCEYLKDTLVYEKGESDAIFMEHRIDYSDREGRERQKVSQLVLFGDETFSAMAKTVGLAAAIGCEEILHTKHTNPKLKQGGVLIPTHKDIYEPMLNKLQHENISFKVFDN